MIKIMGITKINPMTNRVSKMLLGFIEGFMAVPFLIVFYFPEHSGDTTIGRGVGRFAASS